MRSAGFPHSAIQGSKRVCRSPWLIAAYRGLHRLRVPRHSPHAFFRLTTKVVKQITRDLQRVRQQYGLPQLPRRVTRTNREIESPVLIRIPRSLPLSIVKKRWSAAPERAADQTIEIEIGMCEASDNP